MTLLRSPLALLALLLIFHARPSSLSSAASLPTQVRVTRADDFVGTFRLITETLTGGCPKSIEHESGLRGRRIPHGSIKHDNRRCAGGSSLIQITARDVAGSTTIQSLLDEPGGFSSTIIGAFLARDLAILAREPSSRICPSFSFPQGTLVLLLNFDDQRFVDIIDDGPDLRTGDRLMQVYYRANNGVAVGCEYLQRDDSGACFPAAARVTLRDGSAKPISTLQLGDAIQVGPDEHSEVFFFTHRQSDGLHNFVRLTTAAGALTVSPGHYIYLNSRLTAASAARVGDTLTRADGTPTRILRVETVRAPGLYNPQTLHGDIVVDGFKASTYTTAVQPALADALLAPLRSLHRLGAKLDPISRWFDAGGGWLAKWAPKGLIQY